MTRDEVRKMVADGEAVVERLGQSLKTSEASMETLTTKRKQIEATIDRLKRGDDLRAILLESSETSLAAMDQIIEQSRVGLEQQRAQFEHTTSYLRSLRDSIEG
jgi:excinuclease UvrABC ATPase subunit